MELLKKFWKEEDGQDLIEYALLAGVVSLAAVVGMTSLGAALQAGYTSLGDNVTTATS